MDRSRTTTKVVLLSVVLMAGYLLGVGNARAATLNWTNTQVSCSIGTYSDIGQFSKPSSGVATVYQTSTTDNVSGQYHLQNDSNGNNTTARNISDGGSWAWSVGAATWHVWHTAAANVNCNGNLPGNGNTLLTGKVVF